MEIFSECKTLIGDVAQRFHLEQEEQANGNIWFTLVFTSFADFYVERYNDSGMAFITDRIKEIRLKDFDKYTVNGAALKKLVATKLEEIHASEKISVVRFKENIADKAV